MTRKKTQVPSQVLFREELLTRLEIRLQDHDWELRHLLRSLRDNMILPERMSQEEMEELGYEKDLIDGHYRVRGTLRRRCRECRFICLTNYDWWFDICDKCELKIRRKLQGDPIEQAEAKECLKRQGAMQPKNARMAKSPYRARKRAIQQLDSSWPRAGGLRQ